MLKELDRNLRHVNRLYLAPTASAVAVLKSEGFKATTVSDYLIKSGNFKEPDEWRGALVVVDEAGLLSQKQGYDVLKFARKHDNRVLLVGDVKQHSSVEAGDFLRVLETHSKMATHTLADIRRQKPP
jgi:ATP-dependent exoDNAse (exonuclease V) alpha subunit